MTGIDSQQVAWWEVHEFLAAVLAQANCGPLPAAGTPSWAALSDDNPAKLLAVAVAGEHHVLRVEVAQTARAEASKAIAAADNWTALARQVQHGRGPAYIERRTA